MEGESNKRREAHISFESDFEPLESNKYDLESNRYALESEDKDVTSKVKEYLAARWGQDWAGPANRVSSGQLGVNWTEKQRI